MSSSSRLMPRTRLSRGIVVSWDRATATGYAEVAGIGSVPIDGCKEVLAKGDMIRLTLGTSARGLVGLRPCKVDAGLAKPSAVRLRPRPLLVQPSFASADAAAHLLEPPVDEEQLGHLAACRARHAALRSRDSYLEAVSKHATQQLCSLSSEHETSAHRPGFVVPSCGRLSEMQQLMLAWPSSQPITAQGLRTAHAALLSGGGALRTGAVCIGSTRFVTPPEELESLLDELVAALGRLESRADLTPIAKAGWAGDPAAANAGCHRATC